MEKQVVGRLKRKAVAMLELPKEIVLDLPLVSLVGNEEFNIENYKSIIEYTGASVKINTASGIISISGRGLCLKQITSERIKITGFFSKIEYGGY